MTLARKDGQAVSNIRDINSKTADIEVDGIRVHLWSHDSIIESNLHLLHVCIGEGAELVFSSATRGEAMVEAAEFFRALAPALSKLAFEQEGAVVFPATRKRGAR